MPSIIATPFEARALAEGRLSAFVRPVVPQPEMDNLYEGFVLRSSGEYQAYYTTWKMDRAICGPVLASPLGRPGDVLSIKETWCNHYPFPLPDGCKCSDGPCYRATDEGECGAAITGQRWRSGATMPAWAVRWYLPVTSVDVKRAWTITEDEARACAPPDVMNSTWPTIADWHPLDALAAAYDSHWAERGYPWSVNPWVWFARVANAEARARQEGK